MKRKFVELNQAATDALHLLKMRSKIDLSEKSLVSALILYASDTKLNLNVFDRGKEDLENETTTKT